MQEWLNNLYRDTITPNEDGEYGGKGFGAAILKPFVDEESLESAKQRGAVKRTITAAGENPADYNLGAGATVYDAQGAIATQRRKRANQKEGEAHTRALETTMAPVNAQLQLSGQQLAQSGQQFNATMQRMMSQDAKNYQLQLMQLAENRDARAAELEYQKLRDRKADLQYNERMEQLDRKDRRAAMQNLGAGLAALGAAFAL